ncbi:L-cystine-binding protein TcyA [Marinithermofilum abyssi]|uniref:L-cystine-binding protein TcyA n=1 Tax=Marinithermofilum abyssi TaxID=1571185 RepID=A0A8J2VJ19_9BACL|nr:transporter substrate-binding domain-containing protein [Marinithermofilum abyssi]GGE26192.1 L-cystine-binding protein TcyA [Marinithermofilum abyssi]
MKRVTWIVLIIFSLLVTTACSIQSPPQSKSSDTNHLLADIKKRGEIRIGTEGAYKPFSFRDEKTNQLTGYDVDVAKEVAKRLGVKAKFVEGPWDSMLTGLKTGRFDTIANQVGVRADRKKTFDFSKPYTVSYAQIVVHKDNNQIKGLKDVKGKRAAQTPTSNYGKMAKQAGAELVAYEDMMTSLRDVAAKRVDLSINDRLAIAQVMKSSNLPLKTVGEPFEKGVSAFPVPKGNQDLVKEINKALDDMRKDGTLAKISNKWFGEDVSKP